MAADGKPRRIDAEPGAFARREADHRDHLVEGDWKPVLGRQAIIDRQGGDPALPNEFAQHRIPARYAALDEPAAMRKNQQCRPLGVVRQIEAARHLSMPTRYSEVALPV